MNKILAVDTSGPSGITIASAFGKTHIVRFTSANKSKPGIASIVKRLLSELQISAHDLTHLAVGAGPGRFIRTRVGISFVNGLAGALGIPVIKVDSLSILANSCIGDIYKIGALREDVKGGYFYAYSLKSMDDATFDPAIPWRNRPSIINKRELLSDISLKASLWAIDGDWPDDEKLQTIEKALPVAKVYGDAKAHALLQLAEAGIKLNRFCKYAVPIYPN